jgi:hypothetical protein
MAKAQTENTLESLWIERWERSAGNWRLWPRRCRKRSWNCGSCPAPERRETCSVTSHFGIGIWPLSCAAKNSADELPRDAHSTKTSIIEALNRSSAEVSKDLVEETVLGERKTAESVMSFIEHTSEHYGQLVVYARLLGIVPPASRA